LSLQSFLVVSGQGELPPGGLALDGQMARRDEVVEYHIEARCWAGRGTLQSPDSRNSTPEEIEHALLGLLRQAADDADELGALVHGGATLFHLDRGELQLTAAPLLPGPDHIAWAGLLLADVLGEAQKLAMLVGVAPALDVGQALPQPDGCPAAAGIGAGGGGEQIGRIVLHHGEGTGLGQRPIAVAPAVPAVAIGEEVRVEDEPLPWHVQLAAHLGVLGPLKVVPGELGRQGDLDLLAGVLTVLERSDLLPFAQALRGVDVVDVVGESVVTQELLGEEGQVDVGGAGHTGVLAPGVGDLLQPPGLGVGEGAVVGE